METSDDIFMRLAALAQQSGENVSEFRLNFTVQKLLPLGADRVCRALERLLETAKRFPTVAEVKAEMGESELTMEDEARMIVERIAKAVGQFGEIPPGNKVTPGAVRLAIGEAAWDVVGKSGGWNAVTARLGENEVATRAQLRDITAVYLRTGEIERGTLPPAMAASEALDASTKQHRLLLPEAPKMTESERLLLEARLVDLKQQRADELAKHDRAIQKAKRELGKPEHLD
jgi:hypothetical protein